jgi:hypothetical protein
MKISEQVEALCVEKERLERRCERLTLALKACVEAMIAANLETCPQKVAEVIAEENVAS